MDKLAKSLEKQGPEGINIKKAVISSYFIFTRMANHSHNHVPPFLTPRRRGPPKPSLMGVKNETRKKSLKWHLFSYLGLACAFLERDASLLRLPDHIIPMASDQTFVDFITEHIQPEGVQARKMFGEYGLYAGGGGG